MVNLIKNTDNQKDKNKKSLRLTEAYNKYDMFFI